MGEGGLNLRGESGRLSNNRPSSCTWYQSLSSSNHCVSEKEATQVEGVEARIASLQSDKMASKDWCSDSISCFLPMSLRSCEFSSGGDDIPSSTISAPTTTHPDIWPRKLCLGDDGRRAADLCEEEEEKQRGTSQQIS
ncbi:hypothetical protein Dimus_013573 [Dionaea muscipula]